MDDFVDILPYTWMQRAKITMVQREGRLVKIWTDANPSHMPFIKIWCDDKKDAKARINKILGRNNEK